MVEIKVDTQIYRFYHHVNIIGGPGAEALDSGVRKSYFFSELERLATEKNLESNMPLWLIDRASLVGDVSIITSNMCVIMDEANFSPNDINRIFERVREVNAYLITIGRLFIKQIEYSVDAVYEVNMDLQLVKKFVNKTSNSVVFDVATTEDSAAVAYLYGTVLPVEVIPVLGRSRFFKYIKDSSKPLLIADRAKFGGELLLLLERLNKESYVGVLSLFLPESFEEIVLDIIGYDYKDFPDTEFDKEVLYEKILKEEIPWWNKNKLSNSVEYLTGKYSIRQSSLLKKLIAIFNGVGCEYFYQEHILSEEEQEILDMIPESAFKKYKNAVEAIAAFKDIFERRG